MLEQIKDTLGIGQKLEARLNSEYKLQDKNDATVAHIKITNILSDPRLDASVLYEIEETKNSIKEIKKITKTDLEKILNEEKWSKI